MPSAPFRVKALYEYSSPHEDDLSFPPGVIITVTEQEDDDWYGGEYLDDAGVKHEGIFPRNFVEKIEPQAPPRPTRTRTKRESDSAPAPPPVSEPEPVHEPEPEHEQEPEPEPQPQLQSQPPRALPPREKVADVPQAAPVVSPTSPKATAVPIPVPAPVQHTEPEPEPIASKSPPAAKPPPSQSKPAPPPPVSSKPSSNAFRDRIAAFNKTAAPPVAPFKPSGFGSGNTGFIKKPFVAPPPSRNAYIPPVQQSQPTKIYRRDEDPEVREQEAEAQENAERAGFAQSPPAEGDDEDQPKPTSLKERIALLQKQQMEQAQRHAESSGKKVAKRPTKKRTESHDQGEGAAEGLASPPLPQDDLDTDEPERKASLEAERLPPPPRRKSSKGPAPEAYHDGNEADMSGAGDTTEGPEDPVEREEVEERPRRMSRVPTAGPPEPRKSIDRPEPAKEESAEEEAEDEGEEDEEAAEYRRKEELRMRMMKMSGGMGMGHMFGAPPPSAPPKKKKSEPKSTAEEQDDQPISPHGSAPPVPIPGMGMMALPGMSMPKQTEEPEEDDEPVVKSPTSPRAPPPPPARPVDDDEDEPPIAKAPSRTSTDRSAPPPIPGGRPVPPPPAEARPVPPPPPADAADTEGSESDEDVPGAVLDSSRASTGLSDVRSPPPLPPVNSRAPPPLPPTATGVELPQSPTDTSAPSKRLSRLPPPIPGAAPALPPAAPGQARPPPPPPPGGSLSRRNTQDLSSIPPPLPPTRPHDAGDEDEEITEYEGDYDTDIASSVPHKEALKSHARESSMEDSSSLKSPTADAPPPSFPPPVPSTGAPPRAVPPPIPSVPVQSPPMDKRRSVDVPRAAPPPPPPGRETPMYNDEEYDPFNYASPPVQMGGFSQRTPKIEEEPQFPNVQPLPSPPPQNRPPPPAPPGGRGRASMDLPRASMTIRRSMDTHRPSIEPGFIANDIDLATHNGWWKQANQVPPVLQGRKDLYFEAEETTATQGSNTITTRTIYILFQDYSQTILTIVFDPYDQSDVEIDQRHEPPPRQLRQDELEQAYERFGRAISSAVTSKKDSVVGDGTPQALVHELLRPFKDALAPIGARAYGALVYANLANASTQQNDEIRPGDIVSIRNAKFQGKHGAMHAKYTAEVGRPDHVGVVAEWDGTKKKVRAWEQGRENKKVKMESFKLDDLRSGEVKIWRVMPRSWVGWNSQP